MRARRRSSLRVEVAFGDDDPQPSLAVDRPPLGIAALDTATLERSPSAARLELDLLDGEAQVVQAADPGFDGEGVPEGDRLDVEELRPEVLVSTAHRRRRRPADRPSRPSVPATRPGRPARRPRSRRARPGRPLAGRRTAEDGSRWSRRPRDAPAGGRRRGAGACWPGSSRPSRRRRDAGRRGARPWRRAADRDSRRRSAAGGPSGAGIAASDAGRRWPGWRSHRPAVRRCR